MLGVKQQCVLDPDKRVIEKAFRRNALKCHPDKGGDPVVFKKLNDAYLKLIGHIQKVKHFSQCRNQSMQGLLNNNFHIYIA